MFTSVRNDNDLKERSHKLDGRAEARESFQHEALASWQAFRGARCHVTGAEARAWLATWGGKDERAPPECHE